MFRPLFRVGGSGGSAGGIPPQQPSKADNASEVTPALSNMSASASPSEPAAQFAPELSDDAVRTQLSNLAQSSRGALGLNFASPTIAKSIESFTQQFTPGSKAYQQLEQLSSQVAGRLNPDFNNLPDIDKAMQLSDINMMIIQELYAGKLQSPQN